MAVANTAADNPFGPNPFDQTDSRFQLWRGAERDARELLASLQADYWRQMPPESAPLESFTKHTVALVAGVFDAWAVAYCAIAAWNNDAEFHENIFDGFIGGFAKHLIEQVTKSTLGPYAPILIPLGPSAVRRFEGFLAGELDEWNLRQQRRSAGLGRSLEVEMTQQEFADDCQIRAQALVSETRIALLQRLAHWKAEGFRIARQAREAFANAQVHPSPVSAGNGVPSERAENGPATATIRGCRQNQYSERLKAARKRHNLTQAKVATQLQISPDSVKKHEQGTVRPRPEIQGAYATLYKTSIGELFPAED